MKIITSKDNALIKQRALLKNPKSRRQSGLFAVEGLRLCTDAVDSSFDFVEAFFTETFIKAHPVEYEKISNNSKEIITVTPEIMQKLCDTENPQGVFCVCNKPQLELELLKDGKYALLENVSDPSNLGAIARTAEALGLTGLLITGGCDVYNPKALRASMGSLLRLPIGEFDSIEAAIVSLKTADITTYAAVVRDEDKEIRDVNFEKGCAAVIGNEANGLTDTAKSLCDTLVTIRMDGRAESLNVHAASAIFFWEMVRK